MKKFRKGTALLLALCMMLSSVVPALAEEWETDVVPALAEELETEAPEIVEIADAVESIGDIGTITVDEVSEVFEIPDAEISESETADEKDAQLLGASTEPIGNRGFIVYDLETTAFSRYFVQSNTDCHTAKLSKILSGCFISGTATDARSEDSDAVSVIKDGDDWTVEVKQFIPDGRVIWVTIGGVEHRLLIRPYGGDCSSEKTVEYFGSDWMANLNDQKWLGQISIPGSHDSATYDIHFNDVDALYRGIEETVNEEAPGFGTLLKGFALLLEQFWSGLRDLIRNLVDLVQKKSGQCQDLTIEEQLAEGVRYLDLRFRYDNGQFNLYHGDETKGIKGVAMTCNCGINLESVFKTIQQFLYDHPTEFVLLNVQNEGGVYNAKVENDLAALEKKYGIKSNLAAREYSPQKKDAVWMISQATIASCRGKGIDVTGALNDRTNGSWDAKPHIKLEKVREAIRTIGSGPREIQCNVMVKVYKFNDPNKECSFPVWIEFDPVIGKVPTGIHFDTRRFIITPKDNADKINPEVIKMIQGIPNNKTIAKNIAQVGLGVVSMDFMRASYCYEIAKLNTTPYFTEGFTYSGGGKGEGDDDDNGHSAWSNELDKETVDKLVKEYQRSHMDDDDDDYEPLYTGKWNNPVKGGSWSQDKKGIWHYTSSEMFRNTWGYIVNPYAHDGQNKADWFWFDKHGNMLTGWQFIGGKWYYLNPTKDGTLGACQLGGVTPDGWTVDENGAWVESIPRK